MAVDMQVLLEFCSLRQGVVIQLVVSSVLAYWTWAIAYNLFISPLRKIPGPLLWAVSPFPRFCMCISSTPHKQTLTLHRKYGDIVRTGPDSVSCLGAQAWQQVCGASNPENPKMPGFFEDAREGIIGADTETHSFQRRILAPAFSAQGMQRQEPLIRGYVDLLFQRLREHCERGRPVDMVKWMNYFTFDLVGDLAFGEPFGCLKNADYHSWISTVLGFFRMQHSLAHFRRAWPLLDKMLSPFLRVGAANVINEHKKLVKEKVDRRLALGSERPDFVEAMKDKLSKQAILDNSTVLIVAGSETTATVLAGAIYFLCTHPAVLAKLRAEIDGSFADSSEITLLTVARLKYMEAVLDETMRVYPAGAGSVPRIVHKGGQEIAGYFIPQGTTVDIWHWAMYHNPNNWTDVEEFVPERWSNDERFTGDKKDAFKPFSHGKRNCIGKNLAYAEMRLITALLIWNFDMELEDRELYSRKWYDQPLHAVWVKPDLKVKLSLRKGKTC